MRMLNPACMQNALCIASCLICVWARKDEIMAYCLWMVQCLCPDVCVSVCVCV